MKKSKFLLLGSVASLASIPFVAAKCGDTKEEDNKKPAEMPGGGQKDSKTPAEGSQNPGTKNGCNGSTPTPETSMPNNKTDINTLDSKKKEELAKELEKQFSTNPDYKAIEKALQKHFKEIKEKDFLVQGSESKLQITVKGDNPKFKGTLELTKPAASSHETSMPNNKTDINTLDSKKKEELAKELEKQFSTNPDYKAIEKALQKHFKEIKEKDFLVQGSESKLQITVKGDNPKFKGTLELTKPAASSHETSMPNNKTDINTLDSKKKEELAKELEKQFSTNPDYKAIEKALQKHFKEIKEKDFLVQGSESKLQITVKGDNPKFKGTLELTKPAASSHETSMPNNKTDINTLDSKKKEELAKELEKQFSTNPDYKAIEKALQKHFKEIKEKDFLVQGSESKLQITVKGDNPKFKGTLELTKPAASSHETSMPNNKTDINTLDSKKKEELAKELEKQFSTNPDYKAIEKALQKHFKEIKEKDFLVQGSESKLQITVKGDNPKFKGTIELTKNQK
ncbi:variable surface lipoprotein [Mycoplasmopsis agalactiae]|uniref:variable surface lipoprotein n=1 Tax=Mycoplasmopsis agalactiae TaxID=2110 RepID=UPI001F274E59|nr:variable surface lipoprotein [Mycoplasmopsis agalactiae]